MKSFQRVLSIFMFFSLLIGVFALGGCELEKVDDVSVVSEVITSSETLQLESKVKQIDPTIIDELRWLIGNGYIPQEEYNQRLVTVLNRKKPNNDLLGGEGYFVAPDYVYTRKVVQDMMKQSTGDKQARHRRKTYMTNAGTKSVRIHNTLVSAWRVATTDAIAAWNALGYTIKFAGSSPATYVELAGAIDVTTAAGNAYGVPSNVYAFVAPSIACNTCVGELLNINTDYSGAAPTIGTQKSIVAHELGHAIGLGHTDTMTDLDVNIGITCNGTPNYTDFNSIMRLGFTYNAGWVGFTPCDKIVIDYYWGNLA